MIWLGYFGLLARFLGENQCPTGGMNSLVNLVTITQEILIITLENEKHFNSQIDRIFINRFFVV